MDIKRPFKYNPAFLSDDELLDSFCVRKKELEILMESIKENTGEVNQHLLLIGIRGSGKTTLLRRIAVEIKRDDELSSKWHPVVFSEENYEILSLDDFWMQSLYHLKTKIEEEYYELKSLSSRNPYKEWINQLKEYECLKSSGSSSPDELMRKLLKTHEWFRTEESEVPYSEAIGLARLLDFADAQNKRILLICENLQDMLSVIPENDAWRLRKVLQTDHRIMLLASATTRFGEIEDYNQPFYEFFKTITLERLSESDCKILWRKVTGNETFDDKQARALRILTGGQPRLLSVIAWFGKDLSFIQLVRDLEMLVDDHTEYFKGHMEALPPKERKVFATLARLWHDATSSEVAREARMEQTETSSLINRLVKRGIIEESSQGGKKKRAKSYRLTERLYNIYYLMRIGGKYPLLAIKPFIEYVAQVYNKNPSEELEKINASTRDSTGMKIYQPLISIVTSSSAQITQYTDEKTIAIQKMNDEVFELYKKGKWTQESLEKALEILDKNIIKLGEGHAETASAYHNAGIFYSCTGDYKKAIEFCNKALEIYKKILGEEHSGTASTYNSIAIIYKNQGEYDKAIKFYRKALKIKEKIFEKTHLSTAMTYNNIANVYYDQGEYNKAIELYSKVLEIREKELGEEHPDTANIYNNLANIYSAQGEYDKAIEIFIKGLKIYEKTLGEKHLNAANTYNNLANVYFAQGEYDKAIEFCSKALEVREKELGEEHPDTAGTYNNIATVYRNQGEYGKAIQLYNKALKIYEKILGEEHPDTAMTYNNTAIVYKNQREYDKAVEYLVKTLACHTYVSRNLQIINNFCMDIAAVSREMAEILLKAIENSPSRGALSPLIAGIKNYLGLEFRAPLEVREVADDIKKWIEKRVKK